jgi:uncharacterized protein (DUF1778 family)
MSVLKTRNRLINFRLTDEEFHAVHQACAQQGARSVSDFARAAVMDQVEKPRVGANLVRLEEAIAGLDARIVQLVSILQSRPIPE